MEKNTYFKKFLNFLKKFLEKFLEKFLNFLNQKIIFIYFSLYHKKSINKVFEMKRIVLVLFFIILMSSLSAYYLKSNKSMNPLLNQYHQQNQELEKEIVKLENVIGKVHSYQGSYNNEIKKIYTYFGSLDGESLWEKHVQNNDIQLIQNTWNLPKGNWWSAKKDITVLEKINQSRIQLLINIQQLKEIDKYVVLIEKLSQKIPTGWPIRSSQGYKTSGFGVRRSPFGDEREFHTGVDIAALKGSTLLATASGRILFSGDKKSFGKTVIIRHSFGYRTLFAHLSRILVRSGDAVKKGQIIGKVGNTGRSTGPHLHYEVRIGNEYVDPWPYMVSKF